MCSNKVPNWCFDFPWKFILRTTRTANKIRATPISSWTGEPIPGLNLAKIWATCIPISICLYRCLSIVGGLAPLFPCDWGVDHPNPFSNILSGVRSDVQVLTTSRLSSRYTRWTTSRRLPCLYEKLIHNPPLITLQLRRIRVVPVLLYELWCSSWAISSKVDSDEGYAIVEICSVCW